MQAEGQLHCEPEDHQVQGIFHPDSTPGAQQGLEDSLETGTGQVWPRAGLLLQVLKGLASLHKPTIQT